MLQCREGDANVDAMTGRHVKKAIHEAHKKKTTHDGRKALYDRPCGSRLFDHGLETGV